MRMRSLSVVLLANLAFAGPVASQDIRDLIGGIAEGMIQQELDRSSFRAAQEAGTAAAYRDYLQRFPRGQFRANAESALTRLGAPVESGRLSDAEIEARLGITRGQRVAVQRKLSEIGYSTGGADGVWGRNTRNAISNWQRDRGDRVTGYVTNEQLRLLLQGTSVTTPELGNPPISSPGSLSSAQTEASLRLTRTQRTTIQRHLTAIGYDAGVADGLWGSRTRDAIRAWQRANRLNPTGYVTDEQVKSIAAQANGLGQAPVLENEEVVALEESMLELTIAERIDLQRRLTRLGYATNRTDGTFGAGTRRAIANWQNDSGLVPTGYLTAEQVRQIRADSGN